jgi:hypothetical protein
MVARMAASEKDLLARLDALRIAHRTVKTAGWRTVLCAIRSASPSSSTRR